MNLYYLTTRGPAATFRFAYHEPGALIHQLGIALKLVEPLWQADLQELRLRTAIEESDPEDWQIEQPNREPLSVATVHRRMRSISPNYWAKRIDEILHAPPARP